MSRKNITGLSDYQISIPVFEGPLDLLLELIERAELDITTVSLARVTDQFLEYIHQIPSQDPDEVSGFIVIAAKLIQIKSAALLPRPPAIEAELEEDPGEALVRQLKEYKKFKTAAGLLADREQDGYRTYLRLATPTIQVQPKVDMSDFDIDDLVAAAQGILGINNGLLPLDEVVRLPRVTIREKIDTIIKTFRHKESITFSSLLKNHTKVEIVITFLAVLELIKQNLLDVIQERVFADIELHANARQLDDEELEIEF